MEIQTKLFRVLRKLCLTNPYAVTQQEDRN